MFTSKENIKNKPDPGFHNRGRFFFQPKLTVNQPDDVYETEADAMADKVMRMADATVNSDAFFKPANNAVQRKCQLCEEEDKNIHRKENSDSKVQSSNELDSYVHTLDSAGQALPQSGRQFFEPRFGYDFSKVRVHTDSVAAKSAESINALAYTTGNNIVFGQGRYSPSTYGGQKLMAHELTHVVQQNGQKVNVQRSPKAKDDKTATFHYSVKISSPLTSDQLLLEFIKQYKGAATDAEANELRTSANWNWASTPPTVGPADVKKGYVLIQVTDKTINRVSDSDEKAQKEYFKNLPAGEQGAINEAADQQFWGKTKYREGEKLGKSGDDKIMAKDWMTIRNELIKKKQAIDALPENIRKFIFDDNALAAQDPQNYDTVLRISSKVLNLTPAELEEYASRVSAKTTDWAEYENSLDRFIGERQEREKTEQEKSTIETRFYGLDELYKRYRSYSSMVNTNATLSAIRTPEAAGAGLGGQFAINDMRSALEADLIKAGFPGGISDFEKLIRDYERVFETGTVALSKVMLDQYEHTLYLEEAKYKGQASASLFQSVNAGKSKQLYDKADEEHKTGVMSASPAGGGGPQPWVQTHFDEANKLRKQGDTELINTSGGDPLVGNSDFNRQALANAKNETEVQSLMLNYIAERRKNIAATRDNIKDKPNIIYGLNSLFDASLISQNIQKGSVFDQIIHHRKDEVHWDEAIPNIIMSIVAVAAGLLTGGGGTVAVLAAGTALGIGAYQAIEQYKAYEVKSAAYGAKMTSDDPSMAWVIVAIVGASIDLGVFTSVLPKIRPALEAFNAGADVNDIVKLQEKLTALIGAENSITKNIIKAAGAEIEARAAWKGIFKPSPVLYTMPVPYADVAGKLVFAVYQSFSRGIREFQVFTKTNEAIGIIGDIAKMSPQELAVFKTAYLEALNEMETVATFGKTAGMTDNEVMAFMNLRARTKGMTADEVMSQMEIWKTTKSTGIPFGFDTAEKFEEFQKTAASELQKLLKKTDRNAEAFLQGSSITGISYKSHLPFTPKSDMDIAISSSYLFKQADKTHGFAVSLSPKRIGPLDADQIAALGLDRFVKKLEDLTKDAGGQAREVNIMLFDKADAVTKPLGEASTEAVRATVPLKPDK